MDKEVRLGENRRFVWGPSLSMYGRDHQKLLMFLCSSAFPRVPGHCVGHASDRSDAHHLQLGNQTVCTFLHQWFQDGWPMRQKEPGSLSHDLEERWPSFGIVQTDILWVVTNPWCILLLLKQKSHFKRGLWYPKESWRNLWNSEHKYYTCLSCLAQQWSTKTTPKWVRRIARGQTFLLSWFWLQGLFCWMQAFSSYSELGLLCAAVGGLLFGWLLLLWGVRSRARAQWLWPTGFAASLNVSSRIRDWTHVPAATGGFFTTEPPGQSWADVLWRDAMNSIFKNLPRLDLWPRSILENVSCALEKKVKSIVLRWNALWLSIRSN